MYKPCSLRRIFRVLFFGSHDLGMGWSCCENQMGHFLEPSEPAKLLGDAMGSGRSPQRVSFRNGMNGSGESNEKWTASEGSGSPNVMVQTFFQNRAGFQRPHLIHPGTVDYLAVQSISLLWIREISTLFGDWMDQSHPIAKLCTTQFSAFPSLFQCTTRYTRCSLKRNHPKKRQAFPSIIPNWYSSQIRTRYPLVVKHGSMENPLCEIYKLMVSGWENDGLLNVLIFQPRLMTDHYHDNSWSWRLEIMITNIVSLIIIRDTPNTPNTQG